MKIILFILTLTINDFCMGQIPDSSISVEKPKFIDVMTDEQGQKIDSIWLDADTTHFIYKYFKDGEYHMDTVDIEPQPDINFYDGYIIDEPERDKVGKNDTITTFPIQNMDSIIKLCKDSNWSSYSVRGVQVYPFLRPTIKHNYMLFDEMGKDTIPKQDTVWVHIGTNDSMIWRGGGSGEMAEIKTPNKEPVYHRKKDTVLVNCLVSKEEKDQHCGTVYAVQLYSVRELHNVNDDRKDGGWCINCPNYWEHVYFLELSKEPISENIIVWQSKEINQ